MAHDDTIERSTTVCLRFRLHFSRLIFLFALCRFKKLFHFSCISFASFIEGESHLMDDEINEYETTQIDRDDDLNTDDEDDLMTDSDSDK